jgi:D-aminopeptidase
MNIIHGLDNMPGKLFMIGGKELLNRMRVIMTNMWEAEEMSKNWEEGITLLNTSYKMFSNILRERIKPYAKIITGKLSMWIWNWKIN